ncbi:cadherin-like domain-containing protein, partial [Falsiroseomonas bella]|uniref:cadherin-like domain-containing protein n=1 Tax=Falsiroseomonas bella TaxID=2184016 RepID=UPI001304EFAB
MTIRADDGAGGTYDETFTIAVTDVDETPDNTAPVANDDATTIGENVAYDFWHYIDVVANDTDADSDSLFVTGVSVLGGAPVVAEIWSDTEIRFYVDDPNNDWNGAFQLQYSIADGNGGSDTAIVDVTVTPENDAPVVLDDVRTVAEDGSLNGSVAGLADDVDGDGLTFALVGGGLAGLTFNEDGSYSYAPPADFNGTVSFQFTANDGTTDSNIGTVEITVTPVNDAPVVGDDVRTVAEDGSLNGSVAGLADDVDGDGLTFALVGGGLAGLTFNED